MTNLSEKRYIKNNEEIIYQAVVAGELEIDDLGQIWRVAKRGRDRWNQCVRVNKCKRVRAETVNIYLLIKVMLDGKRYLTGAHRLVYRHFYGKIPDGMIINHRDGNKHNNHPENLEPVTSSENAIHSIHVLGKDTRTLNQWGESNNQAKLTSEQVLAIRLRRSLGESLKSIAEDYGVRFQQISRICLGQRRQKG